MDGSPVTPETSYKFKAVTAAHTISATFAINTYTITSSAGAHGSISPASPTVNYGSDQPFTITPETGYHVETLTVDAAAVTPATSYTFKNVTAAHTISADLRDQHLHADLHRRGERLDHRAPRRRR